MGRPEIDTQKSLPTALKVLHCQAGRPNQSTVSTGGSIVSECRQGKWSCMGTKTVSLNP